MSNQNKKEKIDMKEEDDILKKIGKNNPFRVPDGYFEHLTSEIMSRLPEKERSELVVQTRPTAWQRVRPWIYMAAMFVGAALIIRVASSRHPSAAESMLADEAETEMEYVDMVVENAMLDDYSLYVYLSDAEAE